MPELTMTSPFPTKQAYIIILNHEYILILIGNYKNQMIQKNEHTAATKDN